MASVEARVVDQLESMDIEGLVSGLEFTDFPRRDTRSLSRAGGRSLEMTIPAKLWQQADDHSLNDPGEVDVLYWEELGVMMVAFNGGDFTNE